MGIFAIPIFLIYPGQIATSHQIWSFIAIACVFYAISNLLQFLAIKKLEISQVSIIGSTKSFWTLLGSAIVLGEVITYAKITGVLFIILSLTILFWKGKTFKPSKGQILILGAALLSAAAYVFDGLILRNFSASLYLIISSLATGFGTLVLSPKSVNKMSGLFNKKISLRVILISILFTLAVYFLYISYQIGGNISSIIPITQSATILTVIMAAVFLGETTRLRIKIIAALLSGIGIYLLR